MTHKTPPPLRAKRLNGYNVGHTAGIAGREDLLYCGQGSNMSQKYVWPDSYSQQIDRPMGDVGELRVVMNVPHGPEYQGQDTI